MAESEGEIEYLEEDEEVVQQCVRSAQLTTKPVPDIARAASPVTKPAGRSLLIERQLPPKRKNIRKNLKRKQDDDSEYDPSEDELPPSPPSPPPRKKRFMRPLKKPKPDDSASPSVSSVHTKVKRIQSELFNRKSFNIRIPDYDDPLCLPVRAIKAETSDKKRLHNWNSVCLEHFKHCDTLLKPEQGHTTKSVRTAIFRNVINKQTGNNETTIWSKTCVENEEGDKKSEIFQCVLPRYKEKRMLGNYLLGHRRLRCATKTTSEVILSKEDHKDGEALLVYKPKESVTAVYGLIDKRSGEEGGCAGAEGALYLQELTANRVCARCFQASWRAAQPKHNKSVVCPICARTFVTVYNLLSHYKSHAAADAARYTKIMAHILAGIVPYHYRCRACRRQFDTIKELRAHVLQHQSKEPFRCDVCDTHFNV